MTKHLLAYDSPIYNLQVFLRVISQKNPDIPPVLPDGYYGSTTTEAVKAFQSMHNLPPTGVTDNSTWQEIVRVYELIEKESYLPNINLYPEEGLSFENDSFVPTVTIIQTMLLALSEKFSNISAPSINGYVDNATLKSIISFQNVSSIEPDGNITNEFWNILTSAYKAYVSSDRVNNLV